jgi:hypothetical protein
MSVTLRIGYLSAIIISLFILSNSTVGTTICMSQVACKAVGSLNILLLMPLLFIFVKKYRQIQHEEDKDAWTLFMVMAIPIVFILHLVSSSLFLHRAVNKFDNASNCIVFPKPEFIYIITVTSLGLLLNSVLLLSIKDECEQLE